MMIRDYFWLNDDQFSRLEPLLPTDTRGVARVDDRRVISGIIHVLKSGGRWADAPEVYGPRKTLYNRFVRWGDGECRPLAFLLTGGQVADCTAGSLLLEQMPPSPILLGDKGYDSNAIRRQVEERGAMPNIPPKVNRRWKNCFSPYLYRDRNAIERMFGRLKDFRRIATRYDRLAINYLAAVCLAATVCYWL
jgi:transposase